MQAYGAAYTLQELLDQVRRHRRPGQGLRGDRQGREHSRAGHPESFKVLLKELQSLCLNVEVLSSDGAAIEMRDGDDEVTWSGPPPTSESTCPATNPRPSRTWPKSFLSRKGKGSLRARRQLLR
ncbi:hypothetical protein [Gordonia sp. (in: high G+C Gram-positive bacteria)]|uniref:hypothetical protein n=1 Tax=Gordonia sp. (in: high G+C Gram-positive bacteria) TaxID=84139 RepID=UPI00391D6860